MLPIRDNIPSRRYPVVTLCLVVANVLVFLYERALYPEFLRAFFYRYGVVPTFFTMRPDSVVVDYSVGYASLLTSLFLHGGWMHLIGNMWYLWIFGDNVEDRMGRGRFLAFYLLGGVAAGLTQVFLNPESQVPSVGASGAIAAVLGAYVLLYPRARILTLVPAIIFFPIIELPAVWVLGLWFVTQFFSGAGSLVVQTAQSGGVAYWAHVGGFVFGMVAVRLFAGPKPVEWVPVEEEDWEE